MANLFLRKHQNDFLSSPPQLIGRMFLLNPSAFICIFLAPPISLGREDFDKHLANVLRIAKFPPTVQF